jgi:cbb3-type cytochrome oxidase subunit 3
MFKHLFDNAKDIATYPMFSLVVFVVFFVAMTIWVIKTNKSRLEEISRLPLENNSTENSLNS